MPERIEGDICRITDPTAFNAVVFNGDLEVARYRLISALSIDREHALLVARYEGNTARYVALHEAGTWTHYEVHAR